MTVENNNPEDNKELEAPEGVSIGKVDSSMRSAWEDTQEPEETEAPEETESPAPTEEEEDEYEAAPTEVVEDPGVFTPGDYSFEVEDKDGKKVTISTPEEANRFADDDDNFKTAKQLKEFLFKSQKMESKQESEKAEHEAKQAKFSEYSKAQVERIEAVQSIVKGMDYLVSKGLLPAVADEFKDKDWSDPSVASQEGVKEQTELLAYMAKENKSREKAGVPLMTSVIDAYNAKLLEDSRNQRQDQKKQAGEARKAAGARISGVTPQLPNVQPKGIAVGRVDAFKSNASQWQ